MSYQCLIQFMFPGNIGMALRVNELLGNQGKWQLIADECPSRTEPQFEDHIGHFLKCAAICKENRNAVAHAHFIAANEPEFAVLHKGRDRKKGRSRIYRFDLITLREMADETHAIAEYGHHIWALMELARTAEAHPSAVPPPMLAAVKVPLLGKPPQPRKWDQRSQERIQDTQPPPQSSQV